MRKKSEKQCAYYPALELVPILEKFKEYGFRSRNEFLDSCLMLFVSGNPKARNYFEQDMRSFIRDEIARQLGNPLPGYEPIKPGELARGLTEFNDDSDQSNDYDYGDPPDEE